MIIRMRCKMLLLNLVLAVVCEQACGIHCAFFHSNCRLSGRCRALVLARAGPFINFGIGQDRGNA